MFVFGRSNELSVTGICTLFEPYQEVFGSVLADPTVGHFQFSEEKMANSRQIPGRRKGWGYGWGMGVSMLGLVSLRID